MSGSVRELTDYTGRVTSRWVGSVKFQAELALLLQSFVDAQLLLADIPYAFDLDTAIGAQLDATGAWVGLGRTVTTPIPDVYFSWDNTLRGWDRGLWQGPYADPTVLTALDDDTYRHVLYARSYANMWDGTADSAQTILSSFLSYSGTYAIYEEVLQSAAPSRFFSWDTVQAGWDQGTWYSAGDMSASFADAEPALVVGVAGQLPPVVLLFLLEQEAIPLRPAGISVEYRFTSVNGTPLFGFDVQNECISGWDAGSWGVDASYVLNNVPNPTPSLVVQEAA